MLISSFSLDRSLPVLYANVSFKSIDCILLSSFELKAILSISSGKILCLSLLNFCCVFNTNLLFFMIFFKTIYINFIFFWMVYFILKLDCFKTVFIIFKFTFFFMTHFFMPFFFFFYFTTVKVFALIPANFAMNFSPNSFFINRITFLLFPFGKGLSNS